MFGFTKNNINRLQQFSQKFNAENLFLKNVLFGSKLLPLEYFQQ